MGTCVGSKEPSVEILNEAYALFRKIDKKHKNQIDATDIEQYFPNFSDSYAKIMMKEMDHNKDGIITKNEWLGYWEMVRRAGHRNSEIKRQLKLLDNKQMHLNFPRTSSYRTDEPRETVVRTIVQDLKQTAPNQLPFKLQN